MNGPDSIRPVSPESAQIRQNSTAAAKDEERLKKIQELQQKVASGNYRIDLRLLAERLIDSGVLQDE
ncbi:MAG: flagellar biosynthesis anti-sigma factor FlgM [Alicyclobacillus sp.]|nr:flagellar biosynthesis anti-sigma factor FlgM [Alicyclobacillus sp.]